MAATYEQAKAYKSVLERAERDAATKLGSVPGVGSGLLGLTPDAVKFSPEYQDAKRAHSNAFKNLQEFNRKFVKTFAKELKAERTARGR